MCLYTLHMCVYIHVCVYSTRLLNNGILKSQIYFEELVCQNVLKHGTIDLSTH